MIRTLMNRVVVAVSVSLVISLGLWGSPAGATTPTKNAMFCSSLRGAAKSLEVLGGSTAKVSAPDASRTATAIGKAITAAPGRVRIAGRTLVLAYQQLAKGASAVVFASERTATAAATFFTYYTETCLLGGRGRAGRPKTGADQALNLALAGPVAATLSTPDAVDQCTVSNDKQKLECSLVAKGSPFRIDFSISPYPGPGTFDASHAAGSAATLTLEQFDDTRNLAATFAATSGQVVIQRGDVNAGPLIALNPGAVGSIDVMVTLSSRPDGSSVTADGPIHLSGTFACPLSGGGS